MNASFHTLDRATHVKILLTAAVIVVAVMIVSAQLSHAASAVPTPAAAQTLLHPTPRPFWRATPSRSLLMPTAQRNIPAAQSA